jgi:hypothetical protein
MYGLKDANHAQLAFLCTIHYHLRQVGLLVLLTGVPLTTTFTKPRGSKSSKCVLWCKHHICVMFAHM